MKSIAHSGQKIIPAARRLGLALLLAMLLATPAARAQEVLPSADSVKAAYIHKFAAYVDWPPAGVPNATAPIVVGVVGADKVAADLADIAAGRPVQGRPMQVRRLTRAQEAAEVQVLFVGREAWHDATTWIAAARGKPVLVVTDAPRGADMGAVLTFVTLQDRVRFEASVPAAEQGGLRLSSRLLAVAERVVGAGQ